MTQCKFTIIGVILGFFLYTTAASGITVNVDYSFDTNSFFGAGNPDGDVAGMQARNALEAAASFFSNLLDDTFVSIATPPQFHSRKFNGIVTWNWRHTFTNPQTGYTRSVYDDTIATDEFRIYVGARDLEDPTLGIGGPGGFGWSSSPAGYFTTGEIDKIAQIRAAFETAVEMRDEASGFAGWGGAIAFDTSDTNWHFDHNVAPTGMVNDFYSVALHEIGHALGLGSSDSWNDWVSGENFIGPEAMAAYGESAVPLACDSDCTHWQEETSSTIYGTTTIQEAALDPKISKGERKVFTTLDVAALDDIGWDIVAVTLVMSGDYDHSGQVGLGDLNLVLFNWNIDGVNLLAEWVNHRPASGTTVSLTELNSVLFNWGNTAMLANVPEPAGGILIVGLLVSLWRKRHKLRGF